MVEKSIMRAFDKRNLQLLVNYTNWLHDPKSEIKKLSMSFVKSTATNEEIIAVGNAIVTLIGPEGEAYLDGVRDIQYSILRP